MVTLAGSFEGARRFPTEISEQPIRYIGGARLPPVPRPHTHTHGSAQSHAWAWRAGAVLA